MPTAISLALGPISAAVPGSLYQQIVDAVKREIGAGRLAPGSALPSFRVLAAELVVSVITANLLCGAPHKCLVVSTSGRRN
jgi:GntR family transcriptional regulator